MKLGVAINKCRKLRKMTLDDLAGKANLSSSYLSLVESGKRELSLSALQSVSSALKVPIQLLVYLGAEPKEMKEMDSTLKVRLDQLILELIRNA